MTRYPAGSAIVRPAGAARWRHGQAARQRWRRAGVTGGTGAGGGQDRARIPRADEVDDLDVGAEVGDLSGGEVAQPGPPTGRGDNACLLVGAVGGQGEQAAARVVADPLFHLRPADQHEPQVGSLIVLATSRSMPRFSVVSVPAKATCGPAG